MRRIQFEETLLDNHLTRSMGFLGEAAIAFMGDFPEAEVWFDYIVSPLRTPVPALGRRRRRLVTRGELLAVVHLVGAGVLRRL